MPSQFPIVDTKVPYQSPLNQYMKVRASNLAAEHNQNTITMQEQQIADQPRQLQQAKKESRQKDVLFELNKQVMTIQQQTAATRREHDKQEWKAHTYAEAGSLPHADFDDSYRAMKTKEYEQMFPEEKDTHEWPEYDQLIKHGLKSTEAMSVGEVQASNYIRDLETARDNYIANGNQEEGDKLSGQIKEFKEHIERSQDETHRARSWMGEGGRCI